MHNLFRTGALLLLAFAAATGAAPGHAQSSSQPQPGLTSFGTEAALRNFLRGVVAEHRRQNIAEFGVAVPPPPPAPPPPPPPPPAAPGAAPAAISITNTQVTGVDEGDIVKLHGDTLVILRRGRLFTVSLAGSQMRPVDAINAFPPGIDGSGDWYDEMLIAGDRVVVIGYSYRRGGTQVNRFHIDGAGHLAFEDGYQLHSGDYFSSRNYASRLIGNRLILYAPLFLPLEGDPISALPAMRQWQPGDRPGGAFRRIASASHVYVPTVLRDSSIAQLSMLHSVTSCDLSAPRLNCDSTVVIGTYSRTFFVSGNAIYLWVDSAWKHGRRNAANAFVYRIPFDTASRPSAVQARGGPIDQFSFYPDAARGALQVLVRADSGGGDAMWWPEAAAGDVALLSIPMAAFGNGDREVPLDRYQRLPKPVANGWDLQDRFVGDHLLYGGSFDDRNSLTAVSLADHSVHELPIGHRVERIDLVGPDAIVIGGSGNVLAFSTVAFPASGPTIGSTFRLADTREGETRSHAFFFHPDLDSPDASSGILGLPVAKSIVEAGRPYLGESAGMLFLNRRDGRLSEAGELNSRAVAGGDDGCQASCVDWYGNARPIFIGGRMFALLGYELIEGARRGGRVEETGRTLFSPPPPPVRR